MNYLLILFIIVLILIALLFKLYLNSKSKENFSLGYGKGFYQYIKPDSNCDVNNDCYPGSYFRSQLYENMCEPHYGLLKTKRNINDNCLRTLDKRLST